MKAPDTIYLQIHDDECDSDCTDMHEVTWCEDRINDHDTAYVRAELSPYELGKIIVAQKAEIAGLRKVAITYGRHTYACNRLDANEPSHECTCGFTAGLKGEV